MKKYISITALILISGTITADEQLPAFLDLDTNADGFLTSDELVDISDLDLTGVDMDSDGMLSLEEYSALTVEETDEAVEVPTE